MSLTGLLRKDNGSHHAKELRAISHLLQVKKNLKLQTTQHPFQIMQYFSAPYSFTDFRYASISWNWL
jgi:hypothetical protein